MPGTTRDSLGDSPPPGGPPVLEYARPEVRTLRRSKRKPRHFARAASVAAFAFGLTAVFCMAVGAPVTIVKEGSNAAVLGVSAVVAAIVAVFVFWVVLEDSSLHRASGRRRATSSTSETDPDDLAVPRGTAPQPQPRHRLPGRTGTGDERSNP